MSLLALRPCDDPVPRLNVCDSSLGLSLCAHRNVIVGYPTANLHLRRGIEILLTEI